MPLKIKKREAPQGGGFAKSAMKKTGSIQKSATFKLPDDDSSAEETQTGPVRVGLKSGFKKLQLNDDEDGPSRLPGGPGISFPSTPAHVKGGLKKPSSFVSLLKGEKGGASFAADEVESDREEGAAET